MEQTVGVRKRAEGGFGMTITEQGVVTAGGAFTAGGASSSSREGDPGEVHRMLGRKIVAVRGEVRQKPPLLCSSVQV